MASPRGKSRLLYLLTIGSSIRYDGRSTVSVAVLLGLTTPVLVALARLTALAWPPAVALDADTRIVRHCLAA